MSEIKVQRNSDSNVCWTPIGNEVEAAVNGMKGSYYDTIRLLLLAGFCVLGAIQLPSASGQDEPLVPVPDPISGPVIHVPMVPVVIEPDAIPRPPDVGPVPVATLNSGELYVIAHDTQLRIFESRKGIVSITPIAGPVVFWFNKFADGKDREVEETRTYKEPFIYVVRAVKSGEMELILSLVGSIDDSADVRQVLTVVVGPRPPPGPTPVPVPPVPPGPVPPGPDPVPVTPGKLQVVIIEDPLLRAALPASQITILSAQSIRDYMKTHCSATNGTFDFRVLSTRQAVGTQPVWIQAAFAEPRPVLPCIVVSNGTSGFAGALPKTVDETLTLLRKYGGQ